MAKAELKTKENEASVENFINQVEDETKRDDCWKILAMMEKASGKPAKMWGTSIVGFDSYHYKYDSGREGDMCRIGFSPRKQNMTVNIEILLLSSILPLKSLCSLLLRICHAKLTQWLVF